MSNMSQETTSRQDEILIAAFSQFKQYGFRKTSMEDIAQATGISRASLYTHFENKEEIFKSACIAINDQSLDEVAQILKGTEKPASKTSPLVVRMEAALMARYGPLLEIAQSPHGSEIYDENNRLCGELVSDSAKRLNDLLAKALRVSDRAGEINLKNAQLSALATAELIQLAATGVKQGAPDVAMFQKKLSSFLRIFLSGLC